MTWQHSFLGTSVTSKSVWLTRFVFFLWVTSWIWLQTAKIRSSRWKAKAIVLQSTWMFGLWWTSWFFIPQGLYWTLPCTRDRHNLFSKYFNCRFWLSFFLSKPFVWFFQSSSPPNTTRCRLHFRYGTSNYHYNKTDQKNRITAIAFLASFIGFSKTTPI